MTNRKPFPILSALRREGDTFTLGALRIWMYDYHGGPPQTAANDNAPETRPIERETYRYELSAEELIAAYNEDQKHNALGVGSIGPPLSALGLGFTEYKPRSGPLRSLRKRTEQPVALSHGCT